MNEYRTEASTPVAKLLSGERHRPREWGVNIGAGNGLVP